MHRKEFTNRIAMVLLAGTFALVAHGQLSAAPFAQDDLVIATNTSFDNSFRHIRAGAGAVPGVTVDGGVLATDPSPFDLPFMQTVEFDNANGISHNASGNMLAGNFGGAFTGFQVYNFATDGSGNFESIWSIATETGSGTIRGAGLSVSPDNSKLAWAGFDGAQIHVLDYDAGPNPGSGTGASVDGWLSTAPGNGAGGAGGLNPLKPSVTTGTTWLDDNTVLALTGFGELIEFDITGATFNPSTAPTSTPSTSSNWTVVKDGVFAPSPDPSWTSVLYNELIAPEIVIGLGSSFVGGVSRTEVIVWDKDDYTQLAKLNLGTSSQTGREIALDSQGNLYIGGFGEDVVSVINDFVGKATAGTLADNSSVQWFNLDFFASFTGLDVASSVPFEVPGVIGDFDDDGDVDGQDFLIWQRGESPDPLSAGDLADWQGNYGFGPLVANVSAVPEPSMLTLAFIGGMSLALGIRKR